MGIAEILTIVFVVLKLIGQIDWSWWLVLLPEIIAMAIYLGLAIYVWYLNWQARKETKDFLRWIEEERNKKKP